MILLPFDRRSRNGGKEALRFFLAWFLLLCFLWPGAHAQIRPLRLNKRPGLVQRPGRPLDYGVAMNGADAYVAWLGREALALQVFVSRVDLTSLQVLETLQLSEGRGQIEQRRAAASRCGRV